MKRSKPLAGAVFEQICDTKLIDQNGTSLTCGKPARRHLVHEDETGTRFVRTPGGAFVKDRKNS